MKPKHKAGEVIDGWTILDLLGGGGNGEVWIARDARGWYVALKLLSRNERQPKSEPFRRFRLEVETLTALGDFPGILPIVAASPPEAIGAGQVWLAMPIAIPLRDALGVSPKLENAVKAIQRAALVLHDLAEQHDIHHRDLKPENLYQYEGECCVGDFGLVDYPNKETLTSANHPLGSLHYMAPECVATPDSTGEPADVYALAKTLWVLATDELNPQPGHIRRDLPVFQLSSYNDHPRCRQLEHLIERSTHPDVEVRPTMKSFAEDLGDWLNPSIGPRIASLGPELRKRILAAASSGRSIDGANERRVLHTRTLGKSVDDWFKTEFLPRIAEMGLTPEAGGSVPGMEREALEHIPGRHTNLTVVYSVRERAGPYTIVQLSFGLDLVATYEDKTHLFAYHYLEGGTDSPQTLLSESRIADTESVAETNSIVTLQELLAAAVETSLMTFAERLAKESA